MLMFLFMFIISTMFIMFLMNNHPLMLGLFLMFMSIVYSVTIFTYSKTVWLSYILIMVFLSGMMIMFMYMASLSSNENINMNTNTVLMIMLLMLMFNIYAAANKTLPAHKLLPQQLPPLNWKSSTELVYKSYNLLSAEMTLMLITYLFLVLIAAVKISSVNSSPLRTKK